MYPLCFLSPVTYGVWDASWHHLLVAPHAWEPRETPYDKITVFHLQVSNQGPDISWKATFSIQIRSCFPMQKEVSDIPGNTNVQGNCHILSYSCHFTYTENTDKHLCWKWTQGWEDNSTHSFFLSVLLYSSVSHRWRAFDRVGMYQEVKETLEAFCGNISTVLLRRKYTCMYGQPNTNGVNLVIPHTGKRLFHLYLKLSLDNIKANRKSTLIIAFYNFLARDNTKPVTPNKWKIPWKVEEDVTRRENILNFSTQNKTFACFFNEGGWLFPFSFCTGLCKLDRCLWYAFPWRWNEKYFLQDHLGVLGYNMLPRASARKIGFPRGCAVWPIDGALVLRERFSPCMGRSGHV